MNLGPRQTTLWPSGWGDLQFTCMHAELAKTPLQIKGQQDQAMSLYLERLRAAQASNEFLDLRLAELLVATLHRLWPQESPAEAQADTWLQMAVAYLLHTDDTNDDFSAIDGLDDDAEVIIALCQALDRHDLVKPIREHLHR